MALNRLSLFADPPADPTAEQEQLEGEAAIQVYSPVLSLHTASALDPDLIEEDTDELMFMISPDDPFPLVKVPANSYLSLLSCYV